MSSILLANSEAVELIRSNENTRAIQLLNFTLLLNHFLDQRPKKGDSNRSCHRIVVHGHDHHYYQEGQCDEGMSTFSQPALIGPLYSDKASISTIIHFNIGIAYSRIGDEDEAVIYFEKVVDIISSTIPYDSSLPLYTILHNIGHSQWRSGD